MTGDYRSAARADDAGPAEEALMSVWTDAAAQIAEARDRAVAALQIAIAMLARQVAGLQQDAIDGMASQADKDALADLKELARQDLYRTPVGAFQDHGYASLPRTREIRGDPASVGGSVVALGDPWSAAQRGELGLSSGLLSRPLLRVDSCRVSRSRKM